MSGPVLGFIVNGGKTTMLKGDTLDDIKALLRAQGVNESPQEFDFNGNSPIIFGAKLARREDGNRCIYAFAYQNGAQVWKVWEGFALKVSYPIADLKTLNQLLPSHGGDHCIHHVVVQHVTYLVALSWRDLQVAKTALEALNKYVAAVFEEKLGYGTETGWLHDEIKASKRLVTVLMIERGKPKNDDDPAPIIAHYPTATGGGIVLFRQDKGGVWVNPGAYYICTARLPDQGKKAGKFIPHCELNAKAAGQAITAAVTAYIETRKPSTAQRVAVTA